MTDPFPIADDLNAILDDIWKRLGRGAADRRSAFHTPVVGSTDAQGHVHQRVMVLRRVDRDPALLRFHTDIRSSKTSQVDGAGVAVLGYDAGSKIQIRVQGTAAVRTEGAAVDAAWTATSPSGRRSYLTTLAPGAVSATATSGLPGDIALRTPTVEETLRGRANFGLFLMSPHRLEWLHLAHDGHRRAAFTKQGADWNGEWWIP